jgi:transcriptional antiterminator NusG
MCAQTASENSSPVEVEADVLPADVDEVGSEKAPDVDEETIEVSDGATEVAEEAADVGGESVTEAGEEAVAEAGEEAVAEAGEEAVAEAGEEAVAEAGEEAVAEAGEATVVEDSEDAAAEVDEGAAAEVDEEAVTEVAEEALAEVVEPEPLEPQDDRAWYVVHCYSGYENKVKFNLEQRIDTMQMQGQIFQVVVPTEDEMEVRDGKRKIIERRVFPGYLLVQMILTDDSWYVVRNTPGVTGFVGMGNEPTPLRPEEVQAIMRRMEAEAPKIKVTFKQGQKVRIIDGPFNEFIGMVDEIDMERAKVRVLVSFFGRETPVELDFLQVEKT